MKNKTQVIPQWFDGVVYHEGTTVRNPFSGEEYELSALELSIYDFVIGANLFLEKSFENGVEPDDKIENITKDLYKGLDWFRKHNIEAYMALLD